MSGRTSTVTRRGLLGGAAATGLVVGAAAAEASAVGRGSVTGCVDVHAHALPSFYRRALRAHHVARTSGLRTPTWSPKAAVRFMDEHGIAAQVLSVPDPGVTFLRDAGQRVALARRLNDYLHGLTTSKARHLHGRFGAFATLPLAGPGDVVAAIAEAKRALDLGLDGVSLFSNYGTTYLGDPAFRPLLAYLDSRKAVALVQGSNAGVRPATGFSPAVLEAPFNTTRAIVQLSYLGGFATSPDIRWIFADGGGVLPYLSYRTSLLEVYPAAAQNLGLDDLDKASVDFAKLRFDTAWSDQPASLASLRAVTSDQHLLLGTDWPYSRDVLPRHGLAQPALRHTLGRAALTQVTRTNALGLFPRLRGARR